MARAAAIAAGVLLLALVALMALPIAARRSTDAVINVLMQGVGSLLPLGPRLATSPDITGLAEAVRPGSTTRKSGAMGGYPAVSDRAPTPAVSSSSPLDRGEAAGSPVSPPRHVGDSMLQRAPPSCRRVVHRIHTRARCPASVRELWRTNKSGMVVDSCDAERARAFRKGCFLVVDHPVYDVVLAPSCQRGSSCPQPPARLYETCALVSSSGSLRGSRCGPVIDAHDRVFRINVPEVATFEEDVGRFTHFVAVNSHCSQQMAKLVRTIGDPPRPLDARGAAVLVFASITAMAKKMKEIFLRSSRAWNQVNTSALWFVPRRWYQRVFTPWYKAVTLKSFNGVASRTDPTKGFSTLALAAGMCRRVHLFGFTERAPGAPYRYWEAGANRMPGHRHNTTSEHRLLATVSCSHGDSPICRLHDDPSRGQPQATLAKGSRQAKKPARTPFASRRLEPAEGLGRKL